MDSYSIGVGVGAGPFQANRVSTSLTMQTERPWPWLLRPQVFAANRVLFPYPNGAICFSSLLAIKSFFGLILHNLHALVTKGQAAEVYLLSIDHSP